MRILPGPTRSNTHLAWSPCGRWLATGGTGDGAMLWDTFAGTEGQRVLTGGHGTVGLRFVPDSGRLVLMSRSGLWALDVESGQEKKLALRGRNGANAIIAGAFSPDGRLCAVNQWGNTGRAIAVYDLSEPVTPSAEYGSNVLGHDSPFAYRSSEQLFWIDTSWNLAWFSSATGDPLGSIPFPASRRVVSDWALSPDGARAALVTPEALYVAPLDGTPPVSLPRPAKTFRRGLAWSPCGRVLACGCGTTVQLLEADTLAEIRALDWGIGKPRALAFSPDGARCAVSGDSGRGWVAVFDLD
jgi:WD40 repeat protein